MKLERNRAAVSGGEPRLYGSTDAADSWRALGPLAAAKAGAGASPPKDDRALAGTSGGTSAAGH